MPSPEYDIAQAIDAGVSGPVYGTSLFAGPPRGPDSRIPANCVFCLASGGVGAVQDVEAGSGEEYWRPEVAVFVRSDKESYANGLTLARNILAYLHHVTISGYIECTCRESDPLYLGSSDDSTHMWSIGVTLHYFATRGN